MDSRNRSLLPVGVKFKPTDQQLLQYLNFKIHALPYFKGAVLDCDLYGEIEPWEIWLRFGGINGQYLYFFTKLKRLTNNSEHLWAHINRKIGLANGTWSGENSASPIFATKTDKQIIGYCKCFRYENVQLPEHHGEWFMHEYSLHQDSIHQVVDSDYVLCRLSKNERVKRKLLKNLELQQHSKKRIMAPGSTIEQDTMSDVTIDQDFDL
ncbi:NAC domain-containing protein 30-like [Cucurbita pepo subsp. pepo]|uniref:NAC domain-containing protein 30-like n=1 Tax=Cucurbita pepo subsp. pepo TaxID=3664 RepID=UPI000C9D79A4|nr:NAC domain-containing protein 30-like [Cucurbita pepo subsp. pepo]